MLSLVWQNPSPPAKAPSTMQLMILDPERVVYSVGSPGARRNFEVLLGGVAGCSFLPPESMKPFRGLG
jgi:hypothetical protein